MQLRATVLALVLGAIAAGCHQPDQSVDPNDRVAKNLRVVDEGKNKTLTFKADAPGMIRLVDFSSGETLFSTHLAAKDLFNAYPNASHVTINKQNVPLNHDTNQFDTYRLYYLND